MKEVKKAVAILLCIILTTGMGSTAIASDTEQVAGLREKLDALFIRNNFSEEEIAAMNQEYIDWFTERFWTGMLPGLKAMGMMQTKSDEEEYVYRLNEAMIDYDDCVLKSFVTTLRYTNQYAQAGVFSYLFSDYSFWPLHSCRIEKENGFIPDYAKKRPLPNPWHFTIHDEGLELLRDAVSLNDALIARGETEVLDARLFAMAQYLSFLYLKCSENEYLVKLYDSKRELPGIEMYQVYGVDEVMDAILLLDEDDIYTYNRGVVKEAKQTKPTYEAEGEALMEEGLLQGNENGLDPLKPLSRIEATTILVRALGYEDEATQTTPYFVDMAEGSWGVKYANIATDKGITVGVGDNKFAPDQLITANEFATLMLRSSNVGEFDWQQAANLLIERGLLTQEQVEKMDLFTRGDMAKIIYEAKANGLI